MPVTEAVLTTERPSLYLVQFCQHASAMDRSRDRMNRHAHRGHRNHGLRTQAEWDESKGVVTFTPGGRCLLAADADAGTLTIRIEADADQGLRTIQQILSRDFTRFGVVDDDGLAWAPVPRK